MDKHPTFRSRKHHEKALAAVESFIEHGWDALEDDDPEAAEEEGRNALKLAPEAAEAHELLGAALVEQERYGEALPHIQVALRAFPAEPSIELDHALSLIGLYRFREGTRKLKMLVDTDRLNADAHYWLAVAYEMQGADTSAAPHYARAAALESEDYTVPSRVPREEFEGLLHTAIEELPPELKRHLRGEVSVSVSDFPSKELAQSEEPALSPFILGLFTGTALSERSVFESAAMPPMIHIFQRNIERLARSKEEFIEELRITLLHELGHYLGLDEEELEERGLE